MLIAYDLHVYLIDDHLNTFMFSLESVCLIFCEHIMEYFAKWATINIQNS